MHVARDCAIHKQKKPSTTSTAAKKPSTTATAAKEGAKEKKQPPKKKNYPATFHSILPDDDSESDDDELSEATLLPERGAARSRQACHYSIPGGPLFCRFQFGQSSDGRRYIWRTTPLSKLKPLNLSVRSGRYFRTLTLDYRFSRTRVNVITM